MRVLNGHGVTFTVVEPKVAAVFHVEAGTWMAETKTDKIQVTVHVEESTIETNVFSRSLRFYI